MSVSGDLENDWEYFQKAEVKVMNHIQTMSATWVGVENWGLTLNIFEQL